MANQAQTDALKNVLNDPTVPMILRAAQSPIPDGAATLLLADIVECNFAGYAPRPLNDFYDTDNPYADVGEALTDPCIFKAADPLPAAQAITFWYITREPVGQAVILWQVYNLPEPIEVNAPNQEVQVQVRAMGEGLIP